MSARAGSLTRITLVEQSFCLPPEYFPMRKAWLLVAVQASALLHFPLRCGSAKWYCSMQQRLSLGGLLLSLFLLLDLQGASLPNRTVSGHILEVLADGGLRLEEEEPTVAISPSTEVQYQGRAYEGSLLVGLKIKARGRFDPANHTLRAERIDVLSDLGEEIEGAALLEERRAEGDALLFAADGRLLRAPSEIHLSPPEEKSLQAVQSLEGVAPGVFLRYRCRRGPAGKAELVRLSAWLNPLEEKEKALYEQYKAEMLLPRDGTGPTVLKVDENRYGVVGDAEVQRYLDRLGTRLLPGSMKDTQGAAQQGIQFWFFVVQHDRPQASAFPGGVVVVHTGLFRLAENEAQLAFALAHEIAHVTQEHAWREYLYHRKKLSALRWGTAGVGYVVESAIRSGYSRDLEEQADRLALWYMTQAGYDSREGIRFLKRLEEAQLRLPGLLWDTHKSSSRRREALLDELVSYSARGLEYRALTRDSADFAKFRERLTRARTEGVQEAPEVRRELKDRCNC